MFGSILYLKGYKNHTCNALSLSVSGEGFEPPTPGTRSNAFLRHLFKKINDVALTGFEPAFLFPGSMAVNTLP